MYLPKFQQTLQYKIYCVNRMNVLLNLYLDNLTFEQVFTVFLKR